MTTANLMNVPSVNAKVAPQVEASKKLHDEQLKVAEEFAGLMNQTIVLSNPTTDGMSSHTDVKVGDTQSVADSYERFTYKDKLIESAEEPSVNEQIEVAAEDLEKAEQDVLDAISEEYGVSKEEIQSLLDDMGLNVLDLLNPENLVNFIMQLTGITSNEELLLDEKFLRIMETMDSLTKGLMKDLNVNKDALQELVNQMERIPEETKTSEDVQELVDTVTENLNVDESTKVLEKLEQIVDSSVETTVVAENTETTEVTKNTVATENAVETTTTENTESTENTETAVETEVNEKSETTENAEVTATESEKEATEVQVDTKDETSGVETGKVETEDIKVEKTLTEQDSFTNNQNTKDHSFFNQNSNVETVVVNPSNVTMSTVADFTQVPLSSYLGIDTVQIMEQIVQQMKVTLSAEMTSMEMQLNPENLGKVYVNISSEEGVINAQFHATNEVVKEALETQIATLRENLNQAGVKVDAIEVTIASHEFERNLEQNHQNPEEATETQGSQTSKRRNISVDSLDELSGMMTEEETLVAQMMKENGNSIDFTA